MIYINDVLKRCEEKGRQVTKAGIYHAGKKNGFIYKKDGEYELDIVKFNEWLKKSNEVPPAGYVRIKELAMKFGLSLSKAYAIVNDYGCKMKKIGNKGVSYVEQKSFENSIKKHSEKHKYNWR